MQDAPGGGEGREGREEEGGKEGQGVGMLGVKCGRW